MSDKQISATLEEVRSAYSAFSRIFEETTLDPKSTWRVSRLIGQLKPHIKDLSRAEAKMYKDAGGIVSQGGRVTMPNLPGQQEGESLEQYEKRYDAFREKINKISDTLDTELAKTVTINYGPIPVSMLPSERKNEKGETVKVEYRAMDFAECGPFLVEEEEKK